MVMVHSNPLEFKRVDNLYDVFMSAREERQYVCVVHDMFDYLPVTRPP